MRKTNYPASCCLLCVKWNKQIKLRSEIRTVGDELSEWIVYALKNRTTRTIYCRHIGHSLSTLPQFVHVAICPHSNKTHSIAASIQILHKSPVASLSTAANWKRERVCVWEIICDFLKHFSIEFPYPDNFADHPKDVAHVRAVHFFRSIPWNQHDSTLAPLSAASRSVLPIPLWKMIGKYLV